MSWWLRRKKQDIALTLTITPQQIVLLALNHHMEVVHAVSATVPDNIIINHEIQDVISLSQIIRSTYAKARIKEKKVIMAIDTALTIYQYVNLDPSYNETLQYGQIFLNVQQTIPYALNEIALDYQILHHKALWVCARKLHIQKLQQLARLAGLTPTVIDVEAFAIIRASTNHLASINTRNYQTLGIIDINMHRCLFIAIQHEHVLMAHEEEVSQPCFSEQTLSKDTPSPTYLEALHNYIHKLMAIIQRSIQFFENKIEDASLSMLALSAPLNLLDDLKQQIEKTTDLTCHAINPFSNIKLNSNVSTDLSKLNTSLVLALGLAERGLTHA